MNKSVREAVLDAVDYLSSLQREGVRPREARARLQGLRERHADLTIDLLTEEEAFDQSVHYDVLLRGDDESTVSLSSCPDRAVPWPLRGVHRWSEGDLVRVNANVLSVAGALACLDFIWDEEPILERLVNMCLIEEELERHPVDLSDAELQAAMDRFRSGKRLFTTEDTLHWMEQHGMTHEKLERYVAETAVVPKLRDRLTAEHVEEYFRKHSTDFDTVRVARLDFQSEAHARELATQVRAGASFFSVAERLFLEAADRGTPIKENLFAVIERRKVGAALGQQLFSAKPGDLVGPVPSEAGYTVILVLATVAAQLDCPTRNVIKDTLFEDWLRKQRQAAKVEWCWGNVSTT